ncbi:hypothetical protein C071_00964 [Brucella abortus F2/06-8]|nr:hypothetical protein C071_00964 [Brucella abortus F2/06-8]SUW19355.1 phosphoglycolate phosphatase [Brucella abortus]
MKLVLFDCDGTLVDSGDFIHRCMAASFADAGFAPPAVADTYSTIGLSLPLAIARLLGREPDDQVHWLTQRYKENFVTMRQAADFNEPRSMRVSCRFWPSLAGAMTFCSAL